jgi:CO/xanthine dehydrogenase Mo-binding subunit
MGGQSTKNTNATTIVGQSILREDGLVKVTGKAEFTYDVEFPNMLHARFVKSPHAHANIVKIDTEAAKDIPGVHAVLTQEDFPDIKFGDGVFDQTCLAQDRVLFEGQFVAVVAAETKKIAEQAANSVKVTYERLDPIVDGEEAFKKEPPVIVHPDLHSYEIAKVLPPTFIKDRPNVYQHYVVRHGDVESGFEQADYIYEEEYQTAPLQHASMEPHLAVAKPEGNGNLIIWSSCQAMHKIRYTTARILQKQPAKVRIIAPFVGGGFGGKESPLLEPIAGRLAEVTGRPVRVAHTREEEFKNATVSGEVRTKVKTGVSNDGKIIAREVTAILPGGAFASTGFMVARNCTFGVGNSYSIPNISVDTYAVYTNTPVSGSYRGFGNRQVLFGLESQLDEIARDRNWDPIDFRRKNLLREGEVTAFNEERVHVSSKAILDTLEQNLAEPGPSTDIWVSGTGMALVNKYSLAPTASSAIVKVHPDAAVELRYSSDEIGQGNTTAMAQIVAEEFQTTIDKIIIVRGDTSITPFDQGSISSRSTFNMGNAVKMACDDAKNELFQHASQIIEVPAEDLETSNGRVYPKGNPDAGIEIKEVFTAAIYESGYFLKRGGEIIGKDTWVIEAGDPKPGKPGRVNSFYSEGAVSASVRVNIQTGEIKIDKLIGVFDVGKAINPKLVDEQIVGAISMGIAGVLYEGMVYDEKTGRTINANYSDYKIPTIHEHPMVVPIFLEHPHPQGPYGAKGIGESPTVAVIPAIANAITDATGCRFTKIPITPEDVYLKISANK